jgi:hypothetical protein
MRFNIQDWQDKHLNENIIKDWSKLWTTFDKALTQIDKIAKADNEMMLTYIELQDAFERMSDAIGNVHDVNDSLK